MKERPILFSAPMVNAILAGIKTQTRRVVKPQPWTVPFQTQQGDADEALFWRYGQEKEDWPYPRFCPYGLDGDRLWVRETWMQPEHDPEKYRYKATNPSYIGRWRPSIHMPRAASRITLEITGVRVERLQQMPYRDWIADFCPDYVQQERALASFVGREEQTRMAKEFWDSINGKKHPWDSNPWVWVIEFKKLA